MGLFDGQKGYSKEQMLAAANEQPRHRSDEQRAAYAAGQNRQDVRNADHAARAAEKRGL